MKLVLSEEEQFLKDTAKNFAEERSPISHFRSLRDNKDHKLWDKDIWSEMVKLGWPGILIPEEFGGSNFGVTGIGVILQECAKTLTPSPLFATGVLGAYAISEFGNDDQKNNFLPKIVNGEITTALAVDETSHHDPYATELIAKKSNSGFTLSGKKIFVIDGASADLLIVLARTSGSKGDSTGLSLFIMDSNQSGIEAKKLDMADSRNYANIYFNDVSVDESSLLGDLETAGETVESILDIGRIAMSAEMLGNAESAFEITLDYLKQRKQFGALIGSFQALQHRMVDTFMAYEQTKSLLLMCAAKLTDKSDDAKKAVSALKYQVGIAAKHVGEESIQLHGGMGVTDETNIGHYFKRLTTIRAIFGNTDYHLKRYSAL